RFLLACRQGQACRGQRGAYAERSAAGHDIRQLHGAVPRLSLRDYLLNHAHAMRLTRVEVIPGEKPAHGIAPTAFTRHADGRAADRIDPAVDLDLSEARVLGRDADVGRQQELDPDREAEPTHR